MYTLLLSVLFVLVANPIKAESKPNNHHNVFYLNSYALSYSWSDSIIVGILETFKKRSDVMLYSEALDAKRFGQNNFEKQFKIFQDKYSDTEFEVLLASDNDALDFLFQYGDTLFPNVPVVFCGVANVNDYKFGNKKYYGIQEWVEPDSMVNLILKIMPNIENIYYFSDSTTTSLINLNRAKQIESIYKDKVRFKYVTGVDVDSILYITSKIEKNSAIALLDVYSDTDNNHVNTDVLVQNTAAVSKAPLFISSETTLGKGLAGGIIISGSNHGRAAARLALNFIDNPDFVPEQRVVSESELAMFDYKVLKKYNIDLNLIPENAVVINMPHSIWYKYWKFIVTVGVIIFGLLAIIIVLTITISKRKKAELLLSDKLSEIEEKNALLEDSNQHIKDINVELEVTNEKLKDTNIELEVALKKAEESERLKNIFLANLSHEIRTPMNGIIGFSELVNDPEIDKIDRENYTEQIQIESYKLLHVIESLVEVSKIEANQIQLNNSSGTIKELFNILYNTLLLKVPKDNAIKLVQDTLGVFADKNIITDFSKLEYVLKRLLSNAFKFSERGTISFGCTLVKENEIKFYVKDQGVGLAKENMDIIFEKFHQVEGLKGVLQSGVGMGLYISRSYIELMGGKIWLESKQGKGSSFYFTIPYFPETT